MLDFTKAKIEVLTLHRIGNISRFEEPIFANELFKLDKKLQAALLKYFLKPFIAQNDFYAFSHHEDLAFNEVNNFCQNIFNDTSSFVDQSRKVAKHLYNASNHPNILSGELFICRISGIKLDDKNLVSIGVFKAEIKDYFIKYQTNKNKNLSMILERGSNINQLDKGALIFNSDEIKVLVTDKRKADSQYWLKDFLGLIPILNDPYKTSGLLESCLSFKQSVLSKSVEKQSQIKFNQQVIDFFSTNKEFKADEFFDSIQLDAENEKDFKVYVSENIESLGFSLREPFLVDNDKVKKLSKKIRNIIKLDTKIELKVNGTAQETLINIEKGFDEERNMHFYKIYFNEELD